MNHDRLTRSTSRESLCSVSSGVSGIGEWAVGDRCRVNERLGAIAYIGPTRFAPGEWIGVVLDEPHGKNDGSVQGHRYFSCTAHHGLFCKAGKLERVLQSPALKVPRPGASANSPTPDRSSTAPTSPHAEEFGYDVGDRVVVSGNKLGTVRFLDVTEFAQGVWAGVELDQPTGKNDGSVQGKRYFVCKPLYGIFAPAAKTVRAANQSPAKGPMTVRHTKTSVLRMKTAGGSHESLSSIGAASSIASSRRMGPPSKPTLRPNIVSSSAVHDTMISTLQDTIREKEKHVEQLIHERDIERNEMARLSHRCEEAEQRLAQTSFTVQQDSTQTDNKLIAAEKKLKTLEEKYSQLETEHRDLKDRYDEAHRKADDLSFRMEEELIHRAEIEARLTDDRSEKGSAAQEVEKLTKELKESQSKVQNSDAELSKLRLRLAEMEEKALAADKNQQNMQLKKQVDEAERMKLFLSESKNQADGNATKIEVELSELKNKHDEVIQQKNELSGKHQLLLEQTESMEKKIESLQTKSHENEAEIKRLMAENASVRAASEKIGMDHKIFHEKLAEMDKAKQAAVETGSSLQEENQKLCTALTEMKKSEILNAEQSARMQAQLSELEESSRGLQSQLDSTTAELANEKSKLATLEADKKALAGQLESVTSENGELLNQLEDEKTTRSSLETKVTEMESANQLLETRLQSTVTGLKLSAEENSFFKTQTAALESEKSVLSAKLQKAQDEIEAGNNQLVALRSQISSGESNLEADKMKIMNLLEEKQTWELKSAGLENQLKLADEKEKKWTNENKQLVEKISALSTEQENLKESNAQLMITVESLNMQLLEHEDKAAKVAGELDAAEKELTASRNDLIALKETVRSSAEEQAQSSEKLNERDTQIRTLQKEIAQLKKTLESDETDSSKKMALIQQLEAEKTALTQEMDKVKLELQQRNAVMEQCQKEVTDQSKRLAELSALELELIALKDCFETEKASHVVTRETHDSLIAEHGSVMENFLALQEELQGNKEKAATEAEQLHLKLTESEKLKSDMEKELTECKNMLQSGGNRLDELNCELDAVKVENERLKAETVGKHTLLEEMQKKIDEQKSLELHLRTVEKENQALNEQLARTITEWNASKALVGVGGDMTRLKAELEQAKKRCHDMVDENRENCEKRAHECQELRFEISHLRAEITDLKAANDQERIQQAIEFEQSVNGKAKEFAAEIADLKAKLAIAQQTTPRSDNEEVQELSQQVAFLHSIIADQKTKAEKLKEEIEILQRLPDDALATPGEKGFRAAAHVAPLRPYCDICEQFDLHETEDCPVQAMQTVEESDHSHYGAAKGAKAQPRPYCDHCEAFLHDTSECPNPKETDSF